MRIKTLWLLLAALVASLALIAAGCGGDDDGESAGTGTTTEEDGGGEAADQTLTVNWGTEPPSLDPGLASDTTSSNIVYNIFDGLIKLDEDLNPVPNLAESFETSEDGLTVTIVLRDDGAWSNGDPVTAEDFEWSWKRTISPELAADYAYQFYGIEGAQEYNGCEKSCAALADKVGVNAVDDTTLEITLTSPQPWFTQQLAHHSFMAVHRPTVEQFGDKWTEAANIVTNGPFLLDAWEHNASINLVKNEDWRAADDVTLTRVDGRMITDGTTAVQAFEAGEVDVTGGLPVEEIPRLKETEDYQQYPALGTYYYGFNVDTIKDVNQRRAMSLAIDRQSIIDNVAQADQLPTTGFTPKGMPGFDVINPESPWQPATADIEAGQDADGAGRRPGDGHQPAAERRTGAPRDRRCDPGPVEGARPQRQHQAAGVGAVPRVHRAATGSVDRRLPARLDRRLRRRDELPRALDERVGEQQHQLRQ